jgi:hypothetical protein
MCRAIALSHKGENTLGEFIANVFSPLFLSSHVRIAIVPPLDRNFDSERLRY